MEPRNLKNVKKSRFHLIYSEFWTSE